MPSSVYDANVHPEAKFRVSVMHKEVVIGMSHLIEDEKACKDESHAFYGQSIEQEGKTHQVHDDIHLAAVVFGPEKL